MKLFFKKHNANIFGLIILTAIFLVSACNKTETIDDKNIDLELATAQDQTLVADIFDEVSEISDEAVENSDDILGNYKEAEQMQGGGSWNGGNKWHSGHGYRKGWYYDTINLVGRNLIRLSDCATITREINETRDTMIMIIDWGEENCLGPDEVNRRGKFKMTKIGNFYWDADVSITYTFEDYFVNDNEVIGTKTVHAYINENEQRVHEMNDLGSIILTDNAGTITWEATRTRTVVEGSATRMKNDDKIEVTGSSSGSDADGNTYSSEIITPLVRIGERSCFRFYVSGVVEINKSPDTIITIDYGDGTCDNLAEVTTNGETETIELGKNRRQNKN